VTRPRAEVRSLARLAALAGDAVVPETLDEEEQLLRARLRRMLRKAGPVAAKAPTAEGATR
jgi:hypothetical protein